MSQGQAMVPDLDRLAALAPELAAVVVSVSADIALVIEHDGLIRHVALGSHWAVPSRLPAVGSLLVDAVTRDTRAKIGLLLDEAGASGVSRAREVNLPLSDGDGADLPLSLAAVRLGTAGPVLAVGRDLRSLAALQQRFLAAQQALEREHWQQRQADARYRLLFNVATDAVLVVDLDSRCIADANRAAALLHQCTIEQLIGRSLLAGLATASHLPIEQSLAQLRQGARPLELRAWLDGPQPHDKAALVDVSLAPLWQTGETPRQRLLLVRLRRRDDRADAAARRLADFFDRAPDAVVIVDAQGRVLMANPALLPLCPGCTRVDQLDGHPLADLMGDAGQDIVHLLAEVRRQGIGRQLPVTAGGEDAMLLLDVSAALLAEGEPGQVGLILRPRRLDEDPAGHAGSDGMPSRLN